MHPANEPVQQLTEHLFRNESKKMISVLVRIFGTENFETAEDVVQDTLLQAMHIWKMKGIPDNTSGWLFVLQKIKQSISSEEISILFNLILPTRKKFFLHLNTHLIPQWKIFGKKNS